MLLCLMLAQCSKDFPPRFEKNISQLKPKGSELILTRHRPGKSHWIHVLELVRQFGQEIVSNFMHV